MTEPLPVAAVLFDMDGLLLDSERLYLAAFMDTCTEFGLAQDRDLFLSLVGMNGPDGFAALKRGLGGRCDAARFDHRWREIVAELFRAPVPVKPGVHELLAHLRAIGLPHGVATSTAAQTARARLDRAGLSDLADGPLIGGDQVERGKPDPAIYLRAAELIGVPPRSCAAFEDSENGVRAALAAGCRTIQVPDLKSPDDSFRVMGHLVAPSLLAGARHWGIAPPIAPSST